MDATPPQQPAAPPPTAKDPLEDLQDRIAPQLEAAAERLSEANAKVKGFIQENPGTALLGAAAVGYLIGRWASRR